LRLPETIHVQSSIPERMMPMPRKSKPEVPTAKSGAAVPTTLAALLRTLEANQALPPTRRRDLRSAVNGVAGLFEQEPAAIPLDLPAIGARLAAVSPAAVGMTQKRFANIRSDFLAAVKTSGITVGTSVKPALTSAWAGLFRHLSGRRAHIGLSRLARYASAHGLGPEGINDHVVEKFIAAVRQGSLHRNPDRLHQRVTKIWNEAARDRALGLKPVSVPSFRPPPKRVKWELLSEPFRNNVNDYLAWTALTDPFVADARSRPLAPRTLRLRRDQIHAAATALIESGVKPDDICSLADLTNPDNYKKILRRRLESVGGEINTFNYNLGKALIQIATEWVKVDVQTFAELKRLFGKMKAPLPGLTDKNKRFLRQFDDPAALRRLYRLPDRLWGEVRRDSKPNFRTLAKAQVALGIAILSYAALRPENLTVLAFGTHLFMQDGPGAVSTLELSAGEVKNERELAFDITPGLAKMLIEYRDRIAPKIIGHRPTRLFVRDDGKPKSQATVAWLISSYARRRAGIVLTPHQFRHLSAKIALDDQPGAFETVRQHLGHKNTKTTSNFYAGINSRRAARHHHRLVQRILETQMPARRKPRKKSS
jgi:integrase